MSNAKTATFILGAVLPTFRWTVRVPVPGDDDYTHAELQLTFQAVDQNVLDWMRGVDLAPGQSVPTDTEIVQRVVVGWPELRNAKGEAVPFSPEALSMLMASPMVRQATVATYLAAMSGMAVRKNVLTPPAAGPSSSAAAA